MKLNLLRLMDAQACYGLLREIRWSDGVNCPYCNAFEVVKNGFHNQHNYRQRYECNSCNKGFDDLTNTIFSGSKKDLIPKHRDG